MDKQMFDIREINIDENLLIDSKELYKKLELPVSYNKWLKELFNKWHFKEDKDYFKVKTLRKGKPTIIEYKFSIDMSRDVCMLQIKETGAEIRRFLNQFKIENNL